MVDVDETTVLLAAFVILLVPFPLISYGTTEGVTDLWWLGLALLIAGGAVPPLSRYVFEDEDDDATDESAGADGGASGDSGVNEEPGDGTRKG